MWLMSRAGSCSEPVRSCLLTASKVSGLARRPNCEGTECPDVSETARIPGKNLHVVEYRTMHISWAVPILACICNLPSTLHSSGLLSLFQATSDEVGMSGDSAHSESPETLSSLGQDTELTCISVLALQH